MFKTTIKLMACASLAPLAMAAAPAAADPAPQRAKMEQNGTTVPTASEVKAPEREQRTRPQRKTKMSQNGTTVPTANEVRAQQQEGSAQSGQGRTRSRAQVAPIAVARAKAKMRQNGTTVPTASEVKAPEREQKGMIVPAVQQVRASRSSNRKLEQNGTTVPTASELKAPKRDD